MPYHVLSCPVMSNRVKRYHDVSCHVMSNRVVSCRVMSNRVKRFVMVCRVTAGVAMSCPCDLMSWCVKQSDGISCGFSMPWSIVICIIDIFIFITSVYRRYIYNLDGAMEVIEYLARILLTPAGRAPCLPCCVCIKYQPIL